MPYKIFIIKVDGTREETTQDKEPKLDQLQQAVGGPIETIPHFTKYEDLSRGYAYCNEHGKRHGLGENSRASVAWWSLLATDGRPFRRDVINGDVIFYAKVKK